MACVDRRRFLATLGAAGAGVALAGCHGSGRLPPPRTVPPPTPPPVAVEPPEILPGIDALARAGFAPLRGKRVGLLTHAAAVNRAGVPSWRVLHEAGAVNLVALFAPEHGLDGVQPANERIDHAVHGPSGLTIHSLYGATRKPTRAMLQGIDVLVVDLQDIGSRSYTFVSSMRYAAEACLEADKEVVILDRPNPLGGLKVDGPPLDAQLMSFVGAFRVPYVHGMTIGELAELGRRVNGVFQVPQAVRERARLSVVRMPGWTRALRWPDTELRFLPTSPFVPDFAACVGYAMVGLGCELSGFSHGVGRMHPFRTLQFRGVAPERLLGELQALRVPGVGYRIIEVTDPASGRATRTVYVDVTDWEAWRPVDLSLHLHRLGCRLSGRNPFAAASASRAELFNKHVGSREYWDELVARGARADIERFIAQWRERSANFDGFRRRFQLYA